MTHGDGMTSNGTQREEAWSTDLEALRHADRALLAQAMAATWTHALGTPLNVISGRAALIKNDSSNLEETQRNALIIVQQVQQISSMLQQWIATTRTPAPTQGTHTQRALPMLMRAVALVAPWAQTRGIMVHVEQDAVPILGDMIIHIDPEHALQLFSNVIARAVRATPDGAIVAIRGSMHAHTHCARHPGSTAFQSSCVCISVADGGPHIPSDRMAYLLEPLSVPRHGAELPDFALLVCHRILRIYGGWFTLHNRTPGGCDTHLFLPIEGGER